MAMGFFTPSIVVKSNNPCKDDDEIYGDVFLSHFIMFSILLLFFLDLFISCLFICLFSEVGLSAHD